MHHNDGSFASKGLVAVKYSKKSSAKRQQSQNVFYIYERLLKKNCSAALVWT